MRLTGKAATVYKRLPTATKEDLGQLKAVLKAQFEPESGREMQCAWRGLAHRAYPHLQVEVQQQLALNKFLVLLDNPQVAFSVK